MQAGPMTAQPSVPLSCKGSKRVIWGRAEHWQREEDGRMKKIVGFEESQNLPSKSKKREAKELQKV